MRRAHSEQWENAVGFDRLDPDFVTHRPFSTSRWLPVIVLAAALVACGTGPTPTPRSLAISCDSSAFTAFGQQAHCIARLTLSDGSTEDRTSAAQWSSSDSSKITVTSGLVTAVAVGTTDIVATFQSLSARLTFSINVGCVFALTPAAASFGASGGTQIVTVDATPAGCTPSAWTAGSNSPGLTLSPTGGDGSGAVTVTAGPNLGTAQTWTATIAGQAFSANVAMTCSYTFETNSPDSGGNTWRVPSSAGERSVAITVRGESCLPWTAATSDGWISVSQSSGVASETVRLSFAANTGAARAGSVTFRSPNCSPTCGAASFEVFVMQASGSFTLNVTVSQGENLSGPRAATVTGPNGFTCSIDWYQATVQCPLIDAQPGTTVSFKVTVTRGDPGDGVLWRSHTIGCDSFSGPRDDTCTVVVNSNRAVTLAIGCSSCGEPETATERVTSPMCRS